MFPIVILIFIINILNPVVSYDICNHNQSNCTKLIDPLRYHPTTYSLMYQTSTTSPRLLIPTYVPTQSPRVFIASRRSSSYNIISSKRPIQHLIANYYKPINNFYYQNYSSKLRPVTYNRWQPEERQKIIHQTRPTSKRIDLSFAPSNRRYDQKKNQWRPKLLNPVKLRDDVRSSRRGKKAKDVLRQTTNMKASSSRRSDVKRRHFRGKYEHNIFIRVNPRKLEQLNLLLHLEQLKEIKLWNMPKINALVLLHVNPSNEIKVINSIKQVELDYFIITNDLQSLIDSQIDSYLNRTKLTGFNYENYNTYDDVINELVKVSKRHSKYVNYEVIGKSYEGRDIPAIGLSFNGRFKRPAVMIECGIHSREWISPATCLWIINHLLVKQPKNLIKSFDFHFIVIANPDGYDHTWKVDRLWRKNRRLTKSQQVYNQRFNSSNNEISKINSNCQGVDLNRNFDINFLNDGSNRHPCQDNYCGEYAFSESESDSIKNYVIKVSKAKSIKVYIAVHSYSQMWMFPRGYTSLLPPNYHQLSKLSKLASAAIYKSFGKFYKTGPISHVIYKAPGSSSDWSYEVGRIKLSFAVELRDEGEFGFLLPSDQIHDVSFEFFNGLQAILLNVNNSNN